MSAITDSGKDGDKEPNDGNNCFPYPRRALGGAPAEEDDQERLDGDGECAHGHTSLSNDLYEALGGTSSGAVDLSLCGPFNVDNGAEALEKVGEEQGEQISVDMGTNKTPFASWWWVKNVADVVTGDEDEDEEDGER